MQHFNFRRTITIVALFAAILTPALIFGSGSQTGPIEVDSTTPVDVSGTVTVGASVPVSKQTAGIGDFSIKRDNITTASVNIAFGFTSEKIQIISDPANLNEICIDWEGATAICPAANTAGDMRMLPGESLFIDDYATGTISIIADVGTQTVFIRAWN